jgi:hypothetical protein
MPVGDRWDAGGCRWETGYVMPVAIGFNRERAPKPYKCQNLSNLMHKVNHSHAEKTGIAEIQCC